MGSNFTVLRGLCGANLFFECTRHFVTFFLWVYAAGRDTQVLVSLPFCRAPFFLVYAAGRDTVFWKYAAGRDFLFLGVRGLP